MPILATLVVQYVADVSGLQAGVQAAADAVKTMGAAAEDSSGYLSTLGDQAFTTGTGFNGLADTVAELDDSLNTVADATQGWIGGLGGVEDAINGANEATDGWVAGLGGVEDELSGFQAMLDSVKGSLADFASGMLDSVGEGNMFGGMIDSAKGGLSDFFGSIGESIGGIGDLADSLFMGAFKFQIFAQMAEQAINALITPAENLQQMTTAFTTLDGSAKAATDEMQKLDAFASKTPFQTMDIDRAAAQLQGFGVNAKDVIPDLSAIGDALSSVGRGSAADLNRVVDVFGKIQTTGHLTGEIMRQFSDDGINAWAILEKQTGKSQAQLQEMISKGLYPADQAMKDLTKGIEANPIYAGGMAKQSQTFAGVMSTVKSNFDQALASFASPILTALTPTFQGIGNALASPAFKQFASDVGNNIVKIFKGIGDFVGPLIPKFKDIATNFGKVTDAFKDPAIQKLAGEIGGDLKNAITWLVNALASKQFGDFMHLVGVDLVEAIKKATPVVKDVAHAVADFAQSVEEHVKPIIKWWNDNWPTTAQVLRGVWEIIKGVVQAGWSIISNIILIGLDILGGQWGQLWTDVKNLFIGVWEGIKSFIKGVIDVIVGFFHGMYNTIVGHSIIPDLVNGVVDWFEQLPGRVGAAIQSMITTVLNLLGGLVTDATNAGTNIVNGIASGIRNAVGAVTGAISWIGQQISAHLPHSPAKVGPLVDLEYQGSQISNQIAQGMINGVPLINSAIGNLTKPISVGVKGATTTSATTPSNNQQVVIQNHFYVDGKEITTKVMSRAVKELRGHGLKK